MARKSKKQTPPPYHKTREFEPYERARIRDAVEHVERFIWALSSSKWVMAWIIAAAAVLAITKALGLEVLASLGLIGG